MSKQQLNIEVYTFDGANKRHVFFSRLVEMDASVSIPYDAIYNSLRFLFGNKPVVSFSLGSF